MVILLNGVGRNIIGRRGISGQKYREEGDIDEKVTLGFFFNLLHDKG